MQLELDENNYFENNIKVNVLSLRENMEKINKPANKTEWEMTPPMVNAYYTPTKNQIGKLAWTILTSKEVDSTLFRTSST